MGLELVKLEINMFFLWQFIMKGIDKGDILSSGAPQITKDGSSGVNMVDTQSRRTKLGTLNISLSKIVHLIVKH